MAKEIFWLVFSEEPAKKYYINEPINYDKIDFSLDQKENGMGRDVTLSGGKINFRFTINRLHYLEKILYYNHIYGFEADVKLFIQLETNDIFTGELDFYTAETNDFDYFECSVILESALQIFKRRSETKVDLFSNRDINGEAIEPLQPINMLLQAKPSVQISEWKQASPNTIVYSLPFKIFNITQSIISSGINNTLVPFRESSNISESDLSIGETYMILDLQDSLTDIRLSITNINIIASGGGDKRVRIVLIKATEFPGDPLSEGVILFDASSGSDLYINQDINYNIGAGQRGEKIWLFSHLEKDNFENRDFIINSIETKITANSVSYNSITPTFRLIDVMKQIAKSIAGLEVNAPRYDNTGQFYDTVLTNGKLLGGNINDPFYVSWEDIEKSINPEHNADSEIQLDGRVFVGIEEDYYQPIECGFFDNTQFSGMLKKPNPMYCINKFTFKYSKYQSLKETTEPNSESTIHGESQLTPYNQKVENSKECAVEWTRDSILLDVQQRLSTKVSADTATQDDDTIFAIDTIETESDQSFTESTTLQHTYSSSYLSLRSNGEVNFIVLGIRVYSDFVIDYPDSNSGTYNVVSVTNTELQLVKTSGGAISSANDGLRLTKYTYTIEQETIPLTNRTNEGFTTVYNLISPDKYSNLRYSVQRNIRNYWDSFLATVNLYWKYREIKNTYYKNNGKCETEYNGLHIIEKEDFIPTTEPLVTPFMYENVIFANVDFSDFILLQNNIRSQRGFIRTIDNNKRVLKLFPIKMSYQNKSRQLTISGQEKFEKAYLTIVKQGGIITINNETKLRKLTYIIEEGNKVVLFDLERQKLYNSVYFDKVSVNSAIAPTVEVLSSWLDLLG